MSFNIKEFKTSLEINQLFEIWKDEKDVILLDSSKYDSKFSKFSFIGLNKNLKFKSKENNITINEKSFVGEPFKELNKIFEEKKLINIPSRFSNIPFLSGAIGYISYDMSKTMENLPKTTINDLAIDDSYFLFFNNIIIFDLENNKKYITSVDTEKSIEIILEKINKFEENYNKNTDYIYNTDFSKFKSNFEKEDYKKAITKVKDYIKDGHTYITNMTQRYSCENYEDNFTIYSKLRKINPAPFSAYMNLEDISIISSSPERFLNIIDRKVETRPIKGTMPRGNTKEIDGINRNILLNSEKDKSELLMVVDLERNDLSKVCKPSTINVTELFKIEEYATVFHLVSTIEGILDDDINAIDCIKECFPGGSITGTPKIRTMEIIEEVEKLRRGIYTGSIGYFDFRGNCDFNIVIRTILKKDNKAYFGVGGGITIESDEESEYNETLDKANALMRVL